MPRRLPRTQLGEAKFLRELAAACPSRAGTRSNEALMKPSLKFSFLVSLLLSSVLLAACSGLPKSSGGGSGGGGAAAGPFTIGGTVSGLAAGGSMTLQNNGTESLAVSANGPFAFKTAIAANLPYLVTVSVPPATPPQTCTVAGGSGAATANVS